MSVSAIYGNMAGNQITSSAVSGAQKNVQSQQLESTSSYAPLDGDFFQQGTMTSSSTNLASGTLTPVQQAYQSLQQVSTDSGESNSTNLTSAPIQVSGSPARQLPVSANPVGPIEVHDPLLPVSPSPVGPSPIQPHDPMPPVHRSGTNLPDPIRIEDPLTPAESTTVSLIA
ncbi:MAG: hypothetical protein WCB53_17655 [Terriglobales bacterium]